MADYHNDLFLKDGIAMDVEVIRLYSSDAAISSTSFFEMNGAF